MIVITSDLLYITMDCIVFIFLFGRLNVKIINILCYNSYIFASSTQYFGQFIDKLMKFVRFQIYSHFVNLLNPFPNCFRMLIVKLLSDKFFWIVFLTFPFEFFIIESIFSSESRDTTWCWNSGSSYDKNLFMLKHRLHYIFVRMLLKGFIRTSTICLNLRVGVCSHRSSDIFCEFIDDLIKVILKFFNIFLVLLYFLQGLLNS